MSYKRLAIGFMILGILLALLYQNLPREYSCKNCSIRCSTGFACERLWISN